MSTVYTFLRHSPHFHLQIETVGYYEHRYFQYFFCNMKCEFLFFSGVSFIESLCVFKTKSKPGLRVLSTRALLNDKSLVSVWTFVSHTCWMNPKHWRQAILPKPCRSLQTVMKTTFSELLIWCPKNRFGRFHLCLLCQILATSKIMYFQNIGFRFYSSLQWQGIQKCWFINNTNFLFNNDYILDIAK